MALLVLKRSENRLREREGTTQCPEWMALVVSKRLENRLREQDAPFVFIVDGISGLGMVHYFSHLVLSR